MSITGAELTTFRLGGLIPNFFEAHSETELIHLLTQHPDALVIGGGSNLLFGDSPTARPVIRVSTRGVSHEIDACSGATWVVAAGESWDDLVSATIDAECAGFETLSGIPGSVGGAPIQNIGAYGRELNSSVARVRVFDRTEARTRTFTADECGFGYRTSKFKREIDRYVVLELTLQLRVGERSEEIIYPELATELGINLGDRASLHEVRHAVIALRTRKGMVLNLADHDTWSVGSFFINPVLPPSQVPAGAPRWEQENGEIKTSAAWLIENSGTYKGEEFGGARISAKHVLAITNNGSATSSQILECARILRSRVVDKFGIVLVPEVRFVGVEL